MACCRRWFGNSRRIRECCSCGRVGQPVVEYQPECTKRSRSRIEESSRKSKHKSCGNSPFHGCSVTDIAKSVFLLFLSDLGSGGYYWVSERPDRLTTSASL